MLLSERDVVEREKGPSKAWKAPVTPSRSFPRTVTQTLYNCLLFEKLFRRNLLEHICSVVVLLILTWNREKLRSSVSY